MRGFQISVSLHLRMGLMDDYVTSPKFTTKPCLQQIILILWHVARGYSFHFCCFGILFVVSTLKARPGGEII